MKQIALNKNELELSEEYIELLIENEKCEQKLGYEARIEQLEHLKQNKILIKEIYKRENNKMKHIKHFIENSLNEENI